VKLSLIRGTPTPLSIPGEMSVDGQFYSYTLERPEVAIPTGTFAMEITFSPRFNRPLPLLDSVPGRTDIRIHAGNWPRDTEGCLLVGLQRGTDMILQSRLALDPLVAKIQAALDAGDDVRITVS
jgi:Family of unknown function (DUF5675)